MSGLDFASAIGNDVLDNEDLDMLTLVKNANQLINQKSTRYTNLAQLYKGKALMKQKQYAPAIQQFNYTINVAGVSRESAEAQHSQDREPPETFQPPASKFRLVG